MALCGGGIGENQEVSSSMTSEGVAGGKVRILSSVLAGFGFLFRNLLHILHVAWLPGVMIVIAGVIANQIMPQGNITTLTNGEAKAFMSDTLKVMFGYSFFQLMMTLVVVVGIYRLALYDYRPKGPGYFRFYRDEVRVAGVWLLVVSALYIAFMGSIYVFLIAVGGYLLIVGGAPGLASFVPAEAGPFGLVIGFVNEQGGVMFLVYLLFAILFFLWISSRLYLAMPTVVDYRASNLTEAWKATRGNGLRLMIYQIVLNVALMAFIVAVLSLILMAITTANLILISVLGAESINAVVLKTGDIEKVIAGLPVLQKLLISGAVQIFVFFITVLVWSIVIGSATRAYQYIRAEAD
jgi:hypothetical protein